MTTAAPAAGEREHRDVACLGCSLVCDDLILRLEPDRVEATGRACDKARAVYSKLSTVAVEEARIEGKPAPRQAALARAASILDGAELPLITGLDTDVEGVRAALRLAERCGGVIDHAHGDALCCNLRVMQTEGWLATTLGEVRSRADLLLIFGTLPLTGFPRLLERLTGDGERRLGVEGRRRVFLLGPDEEPLPPNPAHYDCRPLAVERSKLAELAGLLRARLAGTNPPPRGAGGLNRETLEELLGELREARYPVLIWAPGEFAGSHGDLAVQRFAELGRELGERARCAALTLSESSGAVTAQQVSTWYCGFPTRVSFAGAVLHYDPHRYATARMLAREEADALLWAGGIDGLTPPATPTIPRIVLGQTPPPFSEEVFIRVGVPGLDHPAQVFRCDGVALSLRKLREPSSPSAAQVLEAIRGRCP